MSESLTMLFSSEVTPRLSIAAAPGTIPVRIHTATKSENVSFHLLHNKCGRAYAISYFCSVRNMVVDL